MDQKVKVILDFIVDLRLLWDMGDSVSKQVNKTNQSINKQL